MVPHRWQVHRARSRERQGALDALGAPGRSARQTPRQRPATRRPRRRRTARLSSRCSAPKGSLRSIRHGKELWRQDLGVMSVGLADDPTYEWGPASSPVIHGNTVIVQNDRYRDSFLIAFDLSDRQRALAFAVETSCRPGRRRSCTRAVGRQPTIVTNSPRFIRGHDLAHWTRALASAGSRRRGQGQHADRGGRSRHRDWRLSRGGPADLRDPRERWVARVATGSRLAVHQHSARA